MSDSVIKGERKASARPAAPSSSSSSAARSRKPTSGTARAGTLAKGSSTGKAPIRKAAKPSSPTPSPKANKANPVKSKQAKATKSAAARTVAAKKTAKSPPSDSRAKIAAKSAPAKSAPAKSGAARKNVKTKQQTAAPTKRQPPTATKAKSTAKAPPASHVSSGKARPSRSARAAAASSRKAPDTTHATPMQLVRQPTRDEAAALQAFERAHKEFARGRFTEAATQFRSIVERFSVAEVTARARTYLAVAEARQRSAQSPPETADALYDRGVLELNRANYIGAQELFERALGQDAVASHIHYALAVTRARLGSRQPAFEALERALELQPNLRARATQDSDLASLRNDAEFERIVFNSRP